MRFGSNKLGKFSVSLALLADRSDKLKEVMSEVTILEATNHFHNNTIEYIGVSDSFRELDEGETIPEYRVIYTSDGVVIFEEVNRK